MDQFPSISIVCPTYNSEDYVINTLSSAVNQTKIPKELIVVDDGSTDNTLLKVGKFFNNCSNLNTFLVKIPHKGPGAARNAGIKQATGDWIAFIDSDDLWNSNKISEVSKIIVEHPEVNFIFHNEDYKKLDGTKIKFHDFSNIYQQDESLALQLWRGCMIHTSTVVCRKDLLLDCGLFDEKLMSSQDWELWIRMSPHIRFYHVRNVLGTYIERLGNITLTKSYRGLLNQLKVMSIHRVNAGASITEYIYRALRSLAGRIGRDLNLISPSIRVDAVSDNTLSISIFPISTINSNDLLNKKSPTKTLLLFPHISLAVLKPLLLMLLSITSSCNNVAVWINSTQVANSIFFSPL